MFTSLEAHGREKGPRDAFVAGTGYFFDPPLKSLSCAWVLSPAISGLVRSLVVPQESTLPSICANRIRSFSTRI
ncbi:hypothetical protein CFD26_102606 [Aspergillus turcosus]|uniref:Uncharacterized protein n=1 Tax=Aspergillus turcosus TaxID=1245748 RepID=A0A3R7IG89_9EURO|nr:hypothetical protein CFD26_102606 [Aspergillus turcosus]